MCGIVGYIGNRNAVPIILDGLRRLEYRGYDSAGIAVVDGDSELLVRRASGKLRNLEEVVRTNPVDGLYGIGHTRWATHGRPTEENAHPHRDCKGQIVVVHNGIVENYMSLKQQLQAEGHTFQNRNGYRSHRPSDREVLSGQSRSGRSLRRQAIEGCVCARRDQQPEPDKIVGARSGPPAVSDLARTSTSLLPTCPRFSATHATCSS